MNASNGAGEVPKSAKPPLLSFRANVLIGMCLAAVAAVLLVLMSFVKAPKSEWPGSADIVQARLAGSPFAPAKFSPVINDDAKPYQAIWYDPDDRKNDLRVWLNSGETVEAISVTTPSKADEVMTAAAVETLLRAASPAFPVTARAAAAQSFAKAMRANPAIEMNAGQVHLIGSGGWWHHTIKANRK